MSNGLRVLGLAAFAVGLTNFGTGQVLAQSESQIPGLIVSVPPDQSGPAPSGSSANPLLQSVTPGLQSEPSSPAVQPRAKPKKRAKPAKKVAKRSPARAPKARSTRRKHGVAILVNDEPITHHEIEQRARLMMVQTNVSKSARAKFQAMVKQPSVNDELKALLRKTIKANPGKSREQILKVFEREKRAFASRLRDRALSSARSGLLPKLRKRAKKQLIEERLKMQEASRLKTLASWKDVDAAIARMAKRNKTDSKTFLGRLSSGGARPTTFKEKIRADLSWSGAIQRRFRHSIAVSARDVDRHASSVSSGKSVKLKLHQIVVPLPKSIDQSVVAARLRDAESLQSRFRGCSSTRKIAQQVSGAVFKDLGSVSPTTVPEPTRSLLLQAQDGEIVPPTITPKGVVLYAVCARTAGADKNKARSRARNALRRREFDIVARRHLADLQRDAHIEYR